MASKAGIYRLKNLTAEPIFLLGIESGCSCVSTADLPISIPGGKTFDFEVLFTADRVENATEVFRWIILNLNVDQPVQVLEFKATIIPNHKENQDVP